MYDLCVVGGGSIGGIITYYGFRGGFERIAVYYGSRRSVERVRENRGIDVVFGDRVYHVPVEAFHYTSPAGKCGFVVNAVKAYNVPNTLDLVRDITGPGTPVLMIQNGFGAHEYFAEKMGYSRILYGVVFIGAERRDPSTIIHRGGNTIYVGSPMGVNADTLYYVDLFRRGGCDMRLVSNIGFYRWLKLGVNAVINPLTAITRSPNGVVLTSHGRRLAEAVIDEVVEAAARKGFIIDRDKLLNIVFRAAANTSGNYSSMAVDVLNNRRTEVDYINGYIAGILGGRGVNWVLSEIIHLIEESYGLNR